MTKVELPCKLQNEDGSVTVKLAEPIRFGDEELISSLKIRAPKYKDIKKMKLSNLSMEDMGALISKLSGVVPSALEEMGVRDFVFCSEVVGDFLGGLETTGKTQ